jgi:hypothetical protein
MVVKVFSGLGKRLLRRFSRLSVAGDSLPVRLRSTTIGLVGLVAAVGLGLVAMISQQSWPEAVKTPLPQAPQSGVVRNDTLALSPAPQSSSRSQRNNSRVAVTQSPLVSQTDGDVHLGGSQQLESPPNAPSPVLEPPASHPEPHGQGPPPPSAAATEPSAAGAPASTAEPPPPAEDAGPLSASEPEISPGNSGQAPGNSSHGNGPPPWTGGGHGPTSENPGGHGKPSWAGH